MDDRVTGFAPVFEKDGNRFIFRLADGIGEDEEEAQKIGVGLAFVEGIFTGSKPTWESVNVENLRHLEGVLGGYPIALISGPLFDEAEKQEEVQSE
jgi:hypothetical protein